MNQFIRKSVAVLSAFLLLASTTSWKVDKHYCMGHMVEMAFFVQTEGCGMGMSDTMEASSSCCSDTTVVVQGLDELQMSVDCLYLLQPADVAEFWIIDTTDFEALAQQVVPHKEYPPPILVRDVHLLDQVFLI